MMYHFNRNPTTLWCPDLNREVSIFSYEVGDVDGFNPDNYGTYDIINLQSGTYIKAPFSEKWIPIHNLSLECGVDQQPHLKFDTWDLMEDSKPQEFIFDREFLSTFTTPEYAIEPLVSHDELRKILNTTQEKKEINITREEWTALMEGA